MSLTKPFITDIKSLLQTARNKAYQAVNTAMVKAYWQIGKRIVEEEQKGSDRANYGEGLIKELSQELTSDFGKGFSTANLKNFRQFYLTFSKGYAVRSFLTWTHYRLIMRLQDEGEINFYLEETAHNQWSTRQLERSMKTNLFKRIPILYVSPFQG